MKWVTTAVLALCLCPQMVREYQQEIEGDPVVKVTWERGEVE